MGSINHLITARMNPAPKANYVGQTVHHEALDDKTEWAGVDCTVADDTVNFKCGGTNAQSVAMTASGTGQYPEIRKLALDTDVDGSHVMMRIYLPEGSGNSAWSKVEQVRLALYDTADGGIQGNLYVFYVTTDNYAEDGWYEVTFPLNEYNSTIGGEADLTHLDRIYVSMKVNDAANTPTVVVDEIRFFNPKNAKGLVTFVFDGGIDDQWEACAYLAAQNLTHATTNGLLRAFVNIAPQQWVGLANYLTLAQLHDLHDAGHVIGLYGLGPGAASWASMSQGQKEATIIAGQDWLARNGFADGMRIFSQHGTSNLTKEDIHELLPAYCDWVTGGLGWTGRLSTRTLWDTRWGFMSAQGDEDGAALLATRLTAVAANKGLLVYLAHCNGATELAAFKGDVDDIVAVINAGNLQPVTPPQIISGAGIL